MNASTEIQGGDCCLISHQRDDFGAKSESQDRTQNTRCNNTYNSDYKAAFAKKVNELLDSAPFDARSTAIRRRTTVKRPSSRGCNRSQLVATRCILGPKLLVGGIKPHPSHRSRYQFQ